MLSSGWRSQWQSTPLLPRTGVQIKPLLDTSGLYYKQVTIVIYDRKDIGLYYKQVTIVIYDRKDIGLYYKTRDDRNWRS